jgi:hypothetical protein
MSLTDVIVGGAIGTAGTAVVSLLSWRRDARALDRSRRVEMSYAGLQAVILAQEAVVEGLDARNRDAWGARFAEVQLTAQRVFEEVLAVGRNSSIDACVMMMRGLANLVGSLRHPQAEQDRAIASVQRARVQVLAPGRFGWRRRRKILHEFLKTE